MTVPRNILLFICLLLPTIYTVLYEILGSTISHGFLVFYPCLALTIAVSYLLIKSTHITPVNSKINLSIIAANTRLNAAINTERDSLRSLLDNLKDYAIMLLDNSGRVISWNTGAERIKGYSSKEIIGKSVETFYTPEDILLGIPARNLQLTREHGRFEDEGWRVKKNGEKFWANVIFTVLCDEKGNVKGFSKITRDITDRRNAERKTALLSRQINQSNDAIYVVDINQRITSWNKGAEKLYGFKEIEALGNDSVAFLQTRITQEKKESILQELQTYGHWAGELQRITNTGTEVYVRSSSTTIKDEIGLIVGYISVNYDVTGERKLAKEVNHLAAIVDQSKDAIISIASSGTIISWNAGAELLYGYSKSESIGNKLHADMFPVELGGIDELLHRVFFQGSWKSEMNFRTKNGEVFFGAASANLVYDINGMMSSIVLIIKDISERKRMEEDLKNFNLNLSDAVEARTSEIYEKEKRFRVLIENISDAIVLNDESSTVLYQSPSVFKILGYAPDERIGQTVQQYIHPDDLEQYNELLSQLRENPSVPHSFQFRSRHKNGSYVWLEGVVNNLLNDTVVHAYVANYRDVTERKRTEAALLRSEELYRNLFQNMLHGFAYCKAIFENEKVVDFQYLAVNSEYEQLIGLKNIAGKYVSEIMPGLLESEVEYAKMVGRVASTGLPEKFESYVPSLGLWLSISLYSPEKNHFVGLVDNITARVEGDLAIKKMNIELEARVMRRTDELRKTNEELEGFSYSVSHDLRAPLRGIIGFVTILEEDYASQLDPEAKRITSVIKSNTLKMGSLIDDLLAFSRLGRQKLTKSVVNMELMVKEVIGSFDTTLYSQNLQWIVHPLATAYGDASSLRQVWINLISNALKYSGKNESTQIEIGSYSKASENVFYIRDNGVGFNPKYIDKLFKVFQRLHGSDEFEGTGVGLAIVDKIISKHGGTVYAEGLVDKGACFKFTIPINHIK